MVWRSTGWTKTSLGAREEHQAVRHLGACSPYPERHGCFERVLTIGAARTVALPAVLAGSHSHDRPCGWPSSLPARREDAQRGAQVIWRADRAPRGLRADAGEPTASPAAVRDGARSPPARAALASRHASISTTEVLPAPSRPWRTSSGPASGTTGRSWRPKLNSGCSSDLGLA